MKKFKKLLLTFCGVLCAVTLSLGLVACGGGLTDDDNNNNGNNNGDQNQTVPKEYTVTLDDYDTEKGTVTLSPAATNGKYAENATVTVNVTPKTGYKVDAVKVNGTALTAVEGVYSFKVTQDSTVAVTFASDAVVPPSGDENTIPAKFIGEWGMEGGGIAPWALDEAEGDDAEEEEDDSFMTLFVITEAGVSVNGSDVIVPTVANDTLTFTVVEDYGEGETWSTKYALSVPDELGGKALSTVMNDETDYPSFYLKKGDTYPTASFTDYVGEWETDENAPSLKIVKDSILINGSSATLLVADATTKTYILYTGSVAFITFKTNDTLTFHYYGEEDAVDYTLFVPDPVDLPTAFQGTWTDGTNTIVVDENGKLKYNDVEYVTFEIDASMNWYAFYDSDVNKWNLEIYAVTNQLHLYIQYDDINDFVLTNSNGVVIAEEYQGTWVGFTPNTLASLPDDDSVMHYLKIGEKSVEYSLGDVTGLIPLATSEGMKILMDEGHIVEMKILNEYGNNVLVVFDYYSDEGRWETEPIYLLKLETEYPTVTFEADLNGVWASSGEVNALVFADNTLKVGESLAFVVSQETSTEDHTVTYKLYTVGGVYTLTYNTETKALVLSDEYNIDHTYEKAHQYTFNFYEEKEYEPEDTYKFYEDVAIADGQTVGSAPSIDVPDPKKTNYDFAGWFIDVNGDEQAFDFDEFVPSDHADTTTFNVYAKWTLKATYTIGEFTGDGWDKTVEKYPEPLKVGDMLTFTGGVELLGQTGASAPSKDRWDGVQVALSTTDFTDRVAFAYDWRVNGATTYTDKVAQGYLTITVNPENWTAGLDSLAASGTGLTVKAVVTRTVETCVQVVYTVKGTLNAKEETFGITYNVTVAADATVAIGLVCDDAKLTDGQIVRTTEAAPEIADTTPETGVQVGTSSTSAYNTDTYTVSLKPGQTLTVKGNLKTSGKENYSGLGVEMTPYGVANLIGANGPFNFRLDNACTRSDGWTFEKETCAKYNLSIAKQYVQSGSIESKPEVEEWDPDWGGFVEAKADIDVTVTIAWTEADKIVLTFAFSNCKVSGYNAYSRTQTYTVTPMNVGTHLAKAYTFTVSPDLGYIANAQAQVTYSAIGD